MTKWRSRIVGQGECDPEQLQANPFNWRIHPRTQRDVVESSLERIGWIQQPVVNRVTGHLIDGHLRVQAAIARGERTIPVLYVDLTEEEERIALASLDPTSALAVTDAEQLNNLLSDLDLGEDALGGMLDDLLAEAGQSLLKSGGQGWTSLGSKAATVKPVIAVSDIALVERALSSVKAASRGAALVEICRAYLGEEGQLDVSPQGDAASIGEIEIDESVPVGDACG